MFVLQMNDQKLSDISWCFAPSMSIYMEVTTLKVESVFMAQCLLNIHLLFMFVGSFIALFRVVGVPVFTDCRLKCLATVVFPLDIWIDMVSGHTGYVPLVFQAKSGSILKNWYIFCCILDEGDILLSLILRLPEMRPTFARNRLASRLKYL